MFSIIKGDDKSEEEAIRLGSIVRVVEAKKANESEKKLVKCLLCCGPYWILPNFRAKKSRNTSWNSKTHVIVRGKEVLCTPREICNFYNSPYYVSDALDALEINYFQDIDMDKVCIGTWIYKLMLNCSSGKKTPLNQYLPCNFLGKPTRNRRKKKKAAMRMKKKSRSMTRTLARCFEQNNHLSEESKFTFQAVPALLVLWERGSPH
ncbi:hypothetical protein Gorai_004339 [Gossypium raimondii]|uniref:Uncharacterized protein n=1 Tax=Gossypium raimondii TaxID=29730 RepID=A0A7J8QIM7_GOSRA|nr:hypothetical protein [Gossypium raimondii]